MAIAPQNVSQVRYGMSSQPQHRSSAIGHQARIGMLMRRQPGPPSVSRVPNSRQRYKFAGPGYGPLAGSMRAPGAPRVEGLPMDLIQRPMFTGDPVGDRAAQAQHLSDIANMARFTEGLRMHRDQMSEGEDAYKGYISEAEARKQDFLGQKKADYLSRGLTPFTSRSGNMEAMWETEADRPVQQLRDMALQEKRSRRQAYIDFVSSISQPGPNIDNLTAAAEKAGEGGGYVMPGLNWSRGQWKRYRKKFFGGRG
jgi:hypothetical protein